MNKTDVVALINAKKVRVKIRPEKGNNFVLLSLVETTALICKLSASIADVYAAEINDSHHESVQ